MLKENKSFTLMVNVLDTIESYVRRIKQLNTDIFLKVLILNVKIPSCINLLHTRLWEHQCEVIC